MNGTENMVQVYAGKHINDWGYPKKQKMHRALLCAFFYFNTFSQITNVVPSPSFDSTLI
jgi:hypothetical protein